MAEFTIIAVGLSNPRIRRGKNAQLNTAKAFMVAMGHDPKYVNRKRLFRFMERHGLAWDETRHEWRNEHDMIDEAVKSLFDPNAVYA